MTMKMTIVAIIALALATAAPQIGAGQESVRPKDATPQPAPYDPLHKFPVEKLKEDLDILWNALDEGHGGF
ncbi:MAG: hypothetical protein ACXVJK_01470, partial [Candidatus Aminicenantales bacterium]